MGIAGYGVVGRRRREHIDRHPNLKTVAVSDRKFDGKKVVDNNIIGYPDYRDLLKHDLDVFFVCMTNNVNPLATIEGLRRGMHVFCEKPPGRTVQDVIDVRKVESENPNLKLKYGFNHRYHDSIRKALAMVESAELGRVINIRGVYGKSKIINFNSTI